MIRWFRGLVIATSAALLLGQADAQTSPGAQPRLALVIGEGAYANASAAPETTAVNDAGLIAYQLQQAGFDVTGGRDVDRAGFESLAATFIAKLGQAGPNAVAVVYISGFGLQAEGDNRIVPADAMLASLDAIGAETISINELLAQLQSIPGAAHIAIFDLARPLPFRIAPQVAPGLAALDPQPGLLVAFSQQPGYVIQEQKQGYGAYASALAEMIRVPGLSLDQLFARTRLRVQTDTKGGQLPWNVSGLATAFTFFTPQTPIAPPPAEATFRSRPIGQLPMEDAFSLAIERDTIDGYQEFIAAYPDGPLARRARAIIAARREAFYWRRTVTRGTPEAYWTYLKHYSRGPHAEEARYRLSLLSEPYSPPATFYEEDYDIPPPPPAEVADEFIPYDRWYELPPPPPPPLIILPPPIVEFYRLPPPPPPAVGFLPPPPSPVPPPPLIIPVPVPVPIPIVGKVPPLPLAVPPKPVIFPPGKVPPGQPQGPTPVVPVGGPGQFKPVTPTSPGQPPKSPSPQPLPAGPGLTPAAPGAPGQPLKGPQQPQTPLVPGAPPQPSKGPIIQPLPVPSGPGKPPAGPAAPGQPSKGPVLPQTPIVPGAPPPPLKGSVQPLPLPSGAGQPPKSPPPPPPPPPLPAPVPGQPPKPPGANPPPSPVISPPPPPPPPPVIKP
ncbi:MAG: caspase family protein, partial [Hyphomicrobiales bacterium]